MKRTPISVAVLALSLAACSPAGPVSSGSSPSVSASATLSADGPAGRATNVTCQELSFYLDPALGSGVLCETVPASTDELEPYPAHTRVTLEGYPLAGTFHTAHIAVFRLSDYGAMLPETLPGLATNLEALAAGAPPPVFSGSFGAGLPFLPAVNAAQAFFARYEAAPFVSGGGIRYLTEYAQYTVTVNNSDLFFSFQGLTSDGEHWVSAVFPISHPDLMATSNDPPGGVTWEEFASDYEDYITVAVADLEAREPGSFSPSIDALDALVSSITITP